MGFPLCASRTQSAIALGAAGVSGVAPGVSGKPLVPVRGGSAGNFADAVVGTPEVVDGTDVVGAEPGTDDGVPLGAPPVDPPAPPLGGETGTFPVEGLAGAPPPCDPLLP